MMHERLHFRMGTIGGLLGTGGGASGTGFGGPTALPTDPTGMSNLESTYNQLGSVANGTGVNPAMAQYNQNVQNLAKQQSGAISSVQGISPALAARMASQQGSAAMQNAAAQGATTQAQQQLGALGQMGTVASTQANVAAGLQQNVNNNNTGLAQTTMQGQQGLIGNVFNAAGGSMGMVGGGGGTGMAEGGEVPPAGPVSQFGQFLQSQASGGTPVSVQASQAPAAVSGMSQGLGGNLKKQKQSPQQSPAVAENSGQGPTQASAAALGAGIPYAQPTYAGFAKGGSVRAMVSPGEQYLSPADVAKVAKGTNALAVGQRIPGVPRVAGNSYANDTVPKTLEAGGVVIPNSIMQSKNPAKGAQDFVANIIAKRKARK